MSPTNPAMAMSPEDRKRVAALFIQTIYEVLTGTGAHADHDREQIGRCVYCSCGQRVQGRIETP